MLARQVEKLSQHLALWHAKLKSLLARRMAHLLTRWHVKMRSWYAFSTLARRQARWHVNQAGTQARWHVDHVGTQARMAPDLANSCVY